MPSTPVGAPPHQPRAAVAPPRRRGGGAGFRPDIEGLRAVAILTVLAYHAGLPVRGGFIGVDVFFVISGFLITGLLVTRARPQRVDLVDPVRGPPHPPPAAGRGARAGAHSVVVVVRRARPAPARHRRRHRGGRDVRRQLGLRPPRDRLPRLRRAARRRCSTSGRWPWRSSSTSSGRCCSSCWRSWCARPSRRVVALALGALVASSFAWSVWFSHTSPRPAFFTTTTRVWELGIGALLAVALRRPAAADRTAARGSAALGWAALAALVAVALWLPAGHRLAGGVGAAADPADRGAALGRLAGAGARPGPGARHRADGLGRRPVVLDLPLALAGHHPGRLDRRRRSAPPSRRGAWSLLAARLGRARVAVVALRRVPDPPRALAARPPSRAARRRPRPVVRRRARRPAAVRAALAVHHHAARRHPAAAVAARRGDPAAGPARSRRSTTPAGSPPTRWSSGEDRPKADVDHCQVPVAATTPVACTFGDPQGATTVALVGDSKAMQWLPALEEAASTRGWRVVTYGKSSCAFSDAPAAQAGAAYPQCDAWNRAVMDALRADPPDVVVTSGVAASAWRPAAAPRASRSSTATPRAGRRLADAGVPVVVVGDSPRLARRPRRLRGAAPDAS